MTTVYKMRGNGRWEFWTYSDRQRIYISAKRYWEMINQGARSVYVRD